MPPKKPQPKPDPNKDIGKFFSVAQYQERAQGRVDRAKEVERGREQAEALEKQQARDQNHDAIPILIVLTRGVPFSSFLFFWDPAPSRAE